MVSGMTMITLYPRAAATLHSPMPVLPEVGSMITESGFRMPLASASSSMLLATRSFTDPAGFRYSSLASTRAFSPRSASRWVSSSRGV